MRSDRVHAKMCNMILEYDGLIGLKQTKQVVFTTDKWQTPCIYCAAVTGKTITRIKCELFDLAKPDKKSLYKNHSMFWRWRWSILYLDRLEDQSRQHTKDKYHRQCNCLYVHVILLVIWDIMDKAFTQWALKPSAKELGPKDVRRVGKLLYKGQCVRRMESSNYSGNKW